MNKVLILYPPAFLCQSKFTRKVRNIVSKLGEFCIIFPNDKNGLIKACFADDSENIALLENTNWQAAAVTHAIVFDDGEEFPAEIAQLQDSGTPLRPIKIAITRVVNIKKETQYAALKSTPDYEYIGRGSYWGNPYSMFGTGDDRDEVIRKFQYDFEYEKFPNKEKAQVFKLAGKRLGCFCKPERCHGDVLAEYLNRWDDGK